MVSSWLDQDPTLSLLEKLDGEDAESEAALLQKEAEVLASKQAEIRKKLAQLNINHAPATPKQASENKALPARPAPPSRASSRPPSRASTPPPSHAAGSRPAPAPTESGKESDSSSDGDGDADDAADSSGDTLGLGIVRDPKTGKAPELF